MNQMMQSRRALIVVKGNPFSESPEDSTILGDFKQKTRLHSGLSNAEKSGFNARC